jgi:hypothetical protein
VDRRRGRGAEAARLELDGFGTHREEVGCGVSAPGREWLGCERATLTRAPSHACPVLGTPTQARPPARSLTCAVNSASCLAVCF